MKPAQILFEKIVVHASVPNEKLIECSEKRRTLFDNIYFNKGICKTAKDYYSIFTEILPQLSDATLKYQPLFQWHNTGSSCWLYEKIHLENIIMNETWDAALSAQELKTKRALFKECVTYGIKALDTLAHYHWEDVSITSMPYMQDRYYLYHICKAASQYYKTMNDFSIKNKSVANTKCLTMAFEYMDIALNVWKSDIYDKEEWNSLKASYLLNMAEKLDDDKCGEKCALLKDIVQVKSIPNTVLAQYNIWKQQNDQVYFQKEETNMSITYSSLKDLFQSLQVIVE